MSYPYGRPGGSGSGGQRGVGVPGGQRGVGVPGGQWVPVAGSGGSGSGGRGSSAGVIVGCLVGLVVAALVVGVAFVALRSGGSEPGSNPTASPTANPTASNPATTGAPTPRATGNGEQYSADFLGGKFHIESTSIVQGPKDKDGADTILVTYRIVNNTSKTQVIGMCVPRLEQKGSKFPRATFKTGEEPEGYDYNSPDEIKPGETLTVMGAYKYLYVGEPVTFRTWAHITEEDTTNDPWGVGKEDGPENDTLWVWQPY